MRAPGLSGAAAFSVHLPISAQKISRLPSPSMSAMQAVPVVYIVIEQIVRHPIVVHVLVPLEPPDAIAGHEHHLRPATLLQLAGRRSCEALRIIDHVRR